MIVIVAGSRECKDKKIIEEAIVKGIEALDIKPKTFIHGDAKGVDKIAGEICQKLGYNVEKYPAKWNDIEDKDPDLIVTKEGKWGKPYSYYKLAGAERNSLMAEKADALIAITLGTSGTDDMIKKARSKGLKVYVYEPGLEDASGFNFWDE